MWHKFWVISSYFLLHPILCEKILALLAYIAANLNSARSFIYSNLTVKSLGISISFKTRLAIFYTRRICLQSTFSAFLLNIAVLWIMGFFGFKYSKKRSQLWYLNRKFDKYCGKSGKWKLQGKKYFSFCASGRWAFSVWVRGFSQVKGCSWVPPTSAWCLTPSTSCPGSQQDTQPPGAELKVSTHPMSWSSALMGWESARSHEEEGFLLKKTQPLGGLHRWEAGEEKTL